MVFESDGKNEDRTSKSKSPVLFFSGKKEDRTSKSKSPVLFFSGWPTKNPAELPASRSNSGAGTEKRPWANG
jgi:hypothetical protein